MPAPVKISQTGIGSSGIYKFNYMICGTAVAIQAVLTGTATYSIQFTLDDVEAKDFDPSTANWGTLAGVLTNATTSRNSFFIAPFQAIRINISSGTGTVVATFCQSGVG